MFAANRNERVSGRTATLVVSTTTRNGFNQSGAPSGRRCAIEAVKFFVKVDKMKDNHSGKARDNVITKCLVKLNTYGFNPIRLVITTIRNKVEIIDADPFRLMVKVRDS